MVEACQSFIVRDPCAKALHQLSGCRLVIAAGYRMEAVGEFTAMEM